MNHDVIKEPWLVTDEVTVWHGDCLEVLRTLPDASVDAVVTDPPYGLEFMGREWDGADGFRRSLNTADVGRDNVFGRTSRTSPEYRALHTFQEWCEQWARECLRVLKPGGHMLAFGGSRTWHRLAAAVEDAGFEIRDSIAWLYGSGFPKSLDVSKAIDKRRNDADDILAVTTRLADLAEAAGVTRRHIDEAMGTSDMGGWWLSRIRGRASVASVENWARLRDLIPGAHELDAEVWRLNGRKGELGEAWSTAAVVATASVPKGHAFAGSTYGGDSASHSVDVRAANSEAARTWEGWGTALKPSFEPIVVGRKPLAGTVAANVLAYGTGALNIDATRIVGASTKRQNSAEMGYHGGNLADSYETGSDAGRWPTNVVLDESQAAVLDKQTGILTSGLMKARTNHEPRKGGVIYGADKRNITAGDTYADSGGASRFFPTFRYEAKAPSSERPKDGEVQHPTVKPLDLMRWLVRLVTPPNGVILEPFAGSGTTVEAALLEGFRCIAIEREADYLPLIEQRITKPLQQSLFGDWDGAA